MDRTVSSLQRCSVDNYWINILMLAPLILISRILMLQETDMIQPPGHGSLQHSSQSWILFLGTNCLMHDFPLKTKEIASSPGRHLTRVLNWLRTKPVCSLLVWRQWHFLPAFSKLYFAFCFLSLLTGNLHIFSTHFIISILARCFN